MTKKNLENVNEALVRVNVKGGLEVLYFGDLPIKPKDIVTLAKKAKELFGNDTMVTYYKDRWSIKIWENKDILTEQVLELIQVMEVKPQDFNINRNFVIADNGIGGATVISMYHEIRRDY